MPVNMMHLNGYIGNWETWVLLACGWVFASLIVSLMVGVIARVGRGKDGGE